MQKLLQLLKDGNSRTKEQFAAELDTTPADINRQLEYLEHIGAIKKVGKTPDRSCSCCTGCGSCNSGGAAACKGCIPKNASANMGEIWEVV